MFKLALILTALLIATMLVIIKHQAKQQQSKAEDEE